MHKKKKLLLHQSLFLQSPFLFPDRRFHMLVAGYGAGKTSSDAYLIEYLASLLQGKRDRDGHRPRILLGGVTIGHLLKTTASYIMQDFENSETDFSYDSKHDIIKVGDVDVLLTPMQNPKDIQGYDVWAAVLDEIDDLGLSTAEDTTFEAVKAVNERTRQIILGLRDPFIAMGSTSQGQLGLYRLYSQFKKSGTGFVKIRGRTRDNIYLPPGYADELASLYTPTEQKVYLEGEFLAISKGQVFGDFNWDRNYLDFDMDLSIASDENLYWGQDFNQGYHRGCVIVLRNGTVYVIKRYEFPDIREAPKVVRYDFPTQKIYWIPDTTSKDEIAHFYRELRHYDIRLVLRSKNPFVEDSAFLVNKLLYTKRLLFARGARETADAVARAQRDDKGLIPKGVGPRSPIHDCLIGSTKIMTLRGERRIDEILPGEQVLTRKGWRRVEAAAYKGVLPVREYAGVWATAEHPFWTLDEGMKACGLLTPCDSLAMLSRKERKLWRLYGYRERLALWLNACCSMGSSTIDTPKRKIATEDISRRLRVSGFMSRCGSIITDLCRRATTCTIRTMIQRIIGLRILSALLSMSTYRVDGIRIGIGRREKTSRQLSRGRLRGTPVLKVWSGTDKMESRLWRHACLQNWFVKNVGPALRACGPMPDSVVVAANSAFTQKKSVERRERVYDLSVEGEHEFFANGVLVSNCDSLRLVCFFLACNKKELADIRHLVLDRRLDLMESETDGIAELNQGYYSVTTH